MVFISLYKNSVLGLPVRELFLLLSLLRLERKFLRPKKREYRETRGEPLQLNILVFYKKPLVIDGRIKKKSVRIIINFENGGLHVSTNFIKKLRLQTKNKQKKYKVNITSELYLITVSRKITFICLKIEKYLKQIIINVIKLAYYNIILKKP